VHEVPRLGIGRMQEWGLVTLSRRRKSVFLIVANVDR
jgi:hypothetical protein